jgi:hypothetical protein
VVLGDTSQDFLISAPPRAPPPLAEDARECLGSRQTNGKRKEKEKEKKTQRSLDESLLTIDH